MSDNPWALGLILVGAVFGFGKNILSRACLRIYAKFHQKENSEKLEKSLILYFSITGAVFTLAGVLLLLSLMVGNR
jgi:hypothetical protein